MRRILLLALLPAMALAEVPRHFSLIPSFRPPEEPGGVAHVAVNFRALDPDLRLNVSPAPRLTLDLQQTVLVDAESSAERAHAGAVVTYDPLTTRYHDPAKPVLFPVTLVPTAPRGEHLVKASVVFFYCSLREAWCRRGTRQIEIPVVVR
jgi:hypothetical protein